jgi:HEAT repeat protein
LNHASNLRKEIDLLLDEWLDETAAALLARFLMDQSKAPEPAARGRTRRSLNVASQSTTPRFLTRGRIG